MKKMSKLFIDIVRARESGGTCQVEHKWNPMDDVIVNSFIPEAFRRVYWHTQRGELRAAYIAATDVLHRLSYEPFLWRLPKCVRVSKDLVVGTAELLQMVEDARRDWYASVQ